MVFKVFLVLMICVFLVYESWRLLDVRVGGGRRMIGGVFDFGGGFGRVVFFDEDGEGGSS